MANDFFQGVQTAEAQNQKNPFNLIIPRIDEAFARKRAERAAEDKEIADLKGALLQLGFKHDYDTELKKEEAKQQRELELLKGEETRKTELFKAQTEGKVKETSETGLGTFEGTPAGAIGKRYEVNQSAIGKPIPQTILAAKENIKQEGENPEEYDYKEIYSTKNGIKTLQGYDAELKPEIIAGRKKEATLKQEAISFTGEIDGMIDALWNTADTLIPAPKSPIKAELIGMGRTAGTASIFGMRPQRAVGLSNEDAIAYKQTIEAEATPLMRAMGEKGMLTQQDIKRGLQLAPHFSDSQQLRKTKKTALNSFLKGKLKAYYSKQGISQSKSNIPSFNTEEEAINSGIKGEVLVNGKRARLD